MLRPSFLLAPFLLLCFLCGACSSTGQNQALLNWTQSTGKMRVLTTTQMVGDLVKEVGGDEVVVLSLIEGEMDPHSYELVKGDAEKFHMADIVFCSGLGLEHGASIRQQLEAHPHSVSLGKYIQEKYPSEILYIDGVEDPHIWMDMSLWAKGAPLIAKCLGELKPEKQEIFDKEALLTQQKFLSIHEKIKAKLNEIPAVKRYLVTSHDAFNYFAKAYLCPSGEQNWNERCVAPEGLAPEGQLSIHDIQKVVKHLLQYHICVVFTESNVSADSMQKIVQATKEKGLSVRVAKEPLYADSMGPKGSLAYPYENMIQYDADVLFNAWQSVQGDL